MQAALRPDKPGTYRVELRVTDVHGVASVAIDSATLVATGESRPPVITSTPVTAAAVAQAYTYDVQAQDPDAGDTLVYSLETFPAGMTIDGASGLIGWTPDAGGPRAVTVRATDSRGLFAEQSFALQVSSPANRAPQAGDDAYEARVGDALSLARPGLLANDSDPDGAPLSVRVRQAPVNGQLFANADGSFTYTPHDLEAGGLVSLNGVNLAALTPGLVLATSSNAQLTTPQMSIDDDISTFWRGNGQAGFFELTFPSDVTVTAIEILGGRQVGLTHTTEASVQFFDAAGVLLHDSGTVSLTAPGDLSYAAPAVGRVRRVRYNALRGTFINAEVHIAEFRVIGSALVARTPQQIPHLGQRLATTAIASSSVAGRSPESAIDGRNQTDWYAVTQAPGEFLELQFPVPVTVTGITGGNPAARPDGFGTSTPITCTGTFELLAGDGTVLFSSGVIAEPTGFSGEPFTIGVPAVSGVRRARYVSAGCGVSSFPPGFSELRILGTADVDAAPFNARLKYQALFGREVHSTPIVINLTDDNFDGLVDSRDVPEIVVPVETIGNQLTGEIKVLSGDDGRELRTMGAGLVSPWAELAAGDIDGDGLPEIVAVHSDGNHLIAFEHDGTQKWVSAANTMPRFNLGNGVIIGGAVAIANLDASGPPEIIVGASVFDDAGALLGDGRTLGGTTAGGSLRTAASAVADIDLDGVPELVAGPTAYRLVNGVLQVAWRRTDRADGYVAIGNFDDDPYAEIAVVANGVAYLLNHDGSDAEVWNAPSHAPVPLPGGGMGGAPTVADLDGDGRPEIGVAASINYIVFDRTGQVRWKSAISDLSSNSTGSTVFDFDGDGSVEVVYRDEAALRIYRGGDGLLLFTTRVSSTTWGEEPVVADIDNDGHAEVVVSSNGGNARGTGVLVFEDIADQWTRTRRIWNQHAYDVTGVDEDGTIPVRPTPNWTLPGLNTFRLNAFVGGAAPDGTDSFTYVATDGELESNEATVRIAVRPRNSAPVITSAPGLTAATGVPYLYAVVANDPDPGDILTFSLETSPAGVTVDSLSGLVRWTPVAGDLGPQAVVVKVADARGRFALQGYTLTVAAPVVVPNVVGLAQGVASSTLDAAGFSAGPLSTQNSPTVAAGLVISQNPSAGTNAAPATPVGIVVSLGAAPAGVVPNVVGMTQPAAQTDIVAAGFTTGAVSGQNSTTPIGIVLAQTPAAGTTSTAGAPVALVVSLGPPPGTLDLDGDGYTGDGGDCDDTNPGRHPGVFDIPGDGIDQNCNGVDSIGGDVTAPVVSIQGPEDLTVVLLPTDIVGTVTDGNLLRYTVTVSADGDSVETTIGTGTTAVTGAVVGRLDPTLLENGLYRVRLVAEDVNGLRAVDERVYRVDGQAKVGVFSLTYTDLQVPLAGIPITVTRTYDSRIKASRDFGIGWTLGVRAGRFQRNRAPGDGWNITDGGGPFDPPCTIVNEFGQHVTEVRLSDREYYLFRARPQGVAAVVGGCTGEVVYDFIG
ncbi:MAG: FG-GAP-like repeat-containing protein, partial [Vicinamibacterales bacterium]